MTERQSSLPVQLFYSYSHKDARFRNAMEKSLALLKKNKLLQDWCDQQILPGKNISPEVRQRMKQANIIVFLFSPDFIASDECRYEWEYAKGLASDSKILCRIPIILRDCPWKDFLGGDDLKALPTDGVPVAQFDDHDKAWLQVYEGIKAVVNELRLTFTPKKDFLKEIDKSDFLSENHLNLKDVFVFLRLTYSDPQWTDQQLRDTIISNQKELLTNKYALIYGQDKAGKTALARHLYLSLVDESQPVLFVDLAQAGSRPGDVFLRETYHAQFHGDYSLWLQQDDTTLILDNVTSAPHTLDFIEEAMSTFDKVIATLSSDIYYSFFKDEPRLANFRQMKIEPLTRRQQEELIRRRLALSDRSEPMSDGFVDEVEDYVNSVIISDRMLPRYPFYVLSILQIYEAYMPSNMSVTSYGHCYHALIVANLMRSGIPNSDDDIGACFNFAEHLAFGLYQHREKEEVFHFGAFLESYKERYFIRDSIVNRLKSRPYGLIGEDGAFRTDYMYYYFLAKFLCDNRAVGKGVIDTMCERSYMEASHLTLLFTIYHSNDNSIIDDILVKTMCTLDGVEPATLEAQETKRFGNIIAGLPENILSQQSVREARGKARAREDEVRDIEVREQEGNVELGERNAINGMYRILKNNKIMGQVLRNKHGSLEKTKVEEIVDIIADSGLRLVNLVLDDEEKIGRIASHLAKRHPQWDIDRVKRALQFLSFVWTMVNVEEVVYAVNVRDIREAIDNVVRRGGTPAHDVIGYFSRLDTAQELSQGERDKLADLLKKHDDVFVQKVLSIRTQYYMNTHRSKAPIEQAVCSLLEIKYVPRLPG